MKNNNIENKLLYYRKLNNYSQKEIALFLKISQPNYSNIENNKISLKLKFAKNLSFLYKIPVSELINDQEGIFISKKDLETLIEAKNIISKIEQNNL